MRQYKNFDEIDRDLKLLKLQKEIDKEKVILSYNHSKESLSPKAILKSMADTVMKSAIFMKGANTILGMIGTKEEEEEPKIGIEKVR